MSIVVPNNAKSSWKKHPTENKKNPCDHKSVHVGALKAKVSSLKMMQPRRKYRPRAGLDVLFSHDKEI